MSQWCLEGTVLKGHSSQAASGVKTKGVGMLIPFISCDPAENPTLPRGPKAREPMLAAPLAPTED